MTVALPGAVATAVGRPVMPGFFSSAEGSPSVKHDASQRSPAEIVTDVRELGMRLRPAEDHGFEPGNMADVVLDIPPVRSYEATRSSHQTGSVATRRKPRHHGRARLVPWIVLFTAIAGVALWVAHPRSSAGLPPPDQRGWGHPGSPGSAQGEKFRTGEIVTIRSHGVTLRVNRRATALFKGFLEELGDGGYPIRQPDTGGYNHRFKRCATPSACEGQLSDHSWGTAIDVNWTSNPLGTHDGCHMTTDMPADITALAERWGLRWGGNFSCRSKDPMHFEVTGRPQDTPLIVERNTGG